MSSRYDVERDHLPPYALINSRADNPILIKFKIGEICEKLSKRFSFHLD
jgi:hypothetical protein